VDSREGAHPPGNLPLMGRRTTVDDETAAQGRALASTQGGVLSRKDALGCGYTSAQLATLVRRKEWTALPGGCLAPVAPPADGALAALQIAGASRLRRAGPGSRTEPGRFIGTGAAAARVLGLPLIERDEVVRMIDRTPPPGRSSALHVSVQDVDLVRRRGVWITTAARTAVELARGRGLLAGVVAADAALRQGVTPEQLHDAAERVSGLRGGRVARQAVGLARPTAESPLESIGRVQLVLHGIPEPEGQREVEDTQGSFIARVDHAWPQFLVIGEADGRSKYEESDDGKPKTGALWEEKKREDRLRVGFEVFRYTWDEGYHHPHLLVAKAEAALNLACKRFRIPSWRST
jgi:hypothetical protein